MNPPLSSTPGTPQAKELLAAAAACERAAAARSPEEEMRAVMGVWAHQETIRLALLARQLQRVAATHRAQERRPLRVEGEDFGRVEARIPKKLFFHLVQQKNFGLDGFCDAGGMKDFLKAFPQCRVNTISGKTVSGTSGRAARAPRRIHFARGTLNLAH